MMYMLALQQQGITISRKSERICCMKQGSALPS